jgi:hypothetical protein
MREHEDAARTQITSVALASYDSDCDRAGWIRDTAVDVLLFLVELGA